MAVGGNGVVHIGPSELHGHDAHTFPHEKHTVPFATILYKSSERSSAGLISTMRLPGSACSSTDRPVHYTSRGHAKPCHTRQDQVVLSSRFGSVLEAGGHFMTYMTFSKDVYFFASGWNVATFLLIRLLVSTSADLCGYV